MQEHPGPKRPGEVQEALGITSTLRHIMNRMVERGVLKRVASGLYELAEESGEQNTLQVHGVYGLTRRISIPTPGRRELMKDLFSSFDRFAASFATGVLLLYGVYLIISWLVPSVYTGVNFLLQGDATKVIFAPPLLVGAYLIGTVNAILSSRLFHYCWKHYDDEYRILDEIEHRGHAILTKEAADLINAKRLILASALPFFLIGIGWILLRDRWEGFTKVNVIGGIICIIAGLSTPLWARGIHLSLRAIHKSLK